ncbi:MAG: hypothetical protein IMZ58_12275 [Thermoplasmata archaeon]|nr:hypothetical protein [Thermoplasmata archaeon]
MKKKYIGWLQKTSNEGEDDLLGLDTEDGLIILAEEIENHIDEYGNFLTVKYFISDKEITETEAIEMWARNLFGKSDAKYRIRCSDLTGYLWTDEELNVGGHNLLDELKGYLHKYLILEIEYSKGEK